MNAGMDLVLVSRTASKLEQVKEEIVQHVKEKKKRSIKVMTFAADLTNVTDEMLEQFSTMIRDLDVGILVNNAGMSLDHPDYLESVDSKVNRDLISINTYAPTAVRFFLLECIQPFFLLCLFISLYIYKYDMCVCVALTLMNIIYVVDECGAARDEGEASRCCCERGVCKRYFAGCSVVEHLCWIKGVY